MRQTISKILGLIWFFPSTTSPMRPTVHALALCLLSTRLCSAVSSPLSASTSANVPAASLFTPVDPFRALGSDRFQCDSCGYRIEAHSARCKDVCFDGDPIDLEDEGEVKEEMDLGGLPENDTDKDPTSPHQSEQGEVSSSSPSSSSSSSTVSASSLASSPSATLHNTSLSPTEESRQTSCSEVTSSIPISISSTVCTTASSGTVSATPSRVTQSSEPVALDAQLLSFEEWKSLQLSKQANRHTTTHAPPPSTPSPSPNDVQSSYTQNTSDYSQREDTSSTASSNPSTRLPHKSGLPTVSSLDAPDSRNIVTPTSSITSILSATTGAISSALPTESSIETSHMTKTTSESSPPSVSVRAPSRRFNYASLDCSARVHYSSPQTRSPAALLHKSKDRYMLTPCQASSYYVVIELCDEIRIDTLEIGNFEFFSSVVKDIRIRAGESEGNGREDAQGDIWKDLGTVRLANIRGMQPFKFDPPTSFHRYIRLDFLSHYGTEYYCPVSLLRVYGMNQMEAYRYEVHMQEKEQELLARWNRDEEGGREPDATRVGEDQGSLPEPVALPNIGNESNSAKDPKPTNASAENVKSDAEEANEISKGDRIGALKARFVNGKKKKSQTSTKQATETKSSTLMVESSASLDSVKYSQVSSVSGVSSTPSSNTITSASIPSSNISVVTSTTSLPSSTSSPDISSANNSHAHQPVSPSQSSSQRPSSRPPSSQAAAHHAPPSHTDSGESIYAFIIRRLTALEDNTSLATWYVDDQVRILRDAWLGLEGLWETWKSGFDSGERERWAGGLEGLRSQQEKMLKSTLRDWNRQRRDLERDKTDMAHRLKVLETEVRLHRKLLIGSLILIIIILACFFAVQVGSVEVAPVIDLTSKSSIKSKERNRRGKSEEPDQRYRRANSPIIRSSSIKRAASPTRENISLDPTPRPSSPSYVYPIPRPRQKNSTHTPNRRPLSYASPTSSHLLPPLSFPINSVSFTENHHRSLANSTTPRARNTLHPSGSASSHYGFRRAARQAHLHTMAGLERTGRAVRPDRPSSPVTRTGKINDQDSTPRRAGSPALIVEGLHNINDQTHDFYSSTPFLVGGDDGHSVTEDGWTPVSTDDETEDADGSVSKPVHQTPPRSLSVPR